MRRWLVPAFHQRQLAKARAYKRRLTGICAECGGPTRYNGQHGQRVSRLCQGCAQRPGRNRYWTEERIVAAIQRWHAEHGKQPAAGDWIRGGPYWPAVSSIYSHPGSPFASWAAAIRAAGFQPLRSRSPGPGKHLWPRETALQLKQQGWTHAAIAAKYGVTTGAISNVFGPETTRRPRKKPKRNRAQRIEDLHTALAKENGDRATHQAQV